MVAVKMSVAPERVVHAALYGNIQILRSWFLFAGGSPNAECEFFRSWSPCWDEHDEDEGDGIFRGRLIHCALYPLGTYRSDRSDLIRFLVSRGAEVNVSTCSKHTPLHFCEFPGELEVLLDAGADINARGQSGITPLHNLSTTPHSLEIMKVLVRRGADVFLEDVHGRNALYFARRNVDGFNDADMHVKTELADFLEKVMAAGTWTKYSNAPRVELVRLRALCARGRAAPPRELERLFDVAALPNEVFWTVISFWRSSRDD